MKQFHLVWRIANLTQVVYTGSVQLCQQRRQELKNNPNYSSGVFSIRTQEGFKASPNFGRTKKNKQY
jgi:hypothetical protein